MDATRASRSDRTADTADTDDNEERRAPAGAEPSDDTGEAVTVEGRAPALSQENVGDVLESLPVSSQTRAWRLTAALGGGLAFDHGSHGLLSLDARFELGRANKLGGESGDAERVPNDNATMPRSRAAH